MIGMVSCLPLVVFLFFSANALLASPALPVISSSGGRSPPPPSPSLHSSCPANFTSLSALRSTIAKEIRYAGHHNFIGRPVAGYNAAECILTVQAATALVAVQRILWEQKVSLKVYDCYRPQKAVDDFLRWSLDLRDQAMKGEFFPRVPKADLFSDGYIAVESAHSKGSTVDVTLISIPADSQEPYNPGDRLHPCHWPEGVRYDDSSLDMGTGFDCFDMLAHTDDPRVTEEQRGHRDLLKKTMESQGWENYPLEWWHFTLRDEPFPDTFFDFDIEPGCGLDDPSLYE